LVVTDEYFAERDLFEVPEDSGGDSQEQYVTLKLRIAPEMAYRAYDEFCESMMEKQADGSYVVTVTWAEDSWLYGFVLSFGEYIEVLEPACIRETIKNKALTISKKYL